MRPLEFLLANSAFELSDELRDGVGDELREELRAKFCDTICENRTVNMPYPADSFESQTYRKADVRLLPFLFLCYILAYLDRVNVGFAKLQMVKDLSLSDAAFATGAGIFFIGYFFFEVPSNVLLKKFGARMWIARIMISWGVISACMIFVKGEWSFYSMRFLLGLAEAGFFPGVIFYLTLWYPSRLRSTRTAWFVAAIAVSGVIGNPVSGWIMDHLSGAMNLAGGSGYSSPKASPPCSLASA